MLLSLAHFLFLGGILLVAGLAVGRPRISSQPYFPLFALCVWILGLGTVYFSLKSRGQVWLARPVRNFEFELNPQANGKLGDHHKIVSPRFVDRLPPEFDRLHAVVAMELQFQLHASGAVHDVRITKSSGMKKLDIATLRTVESWRFAALPASRARPNSAATSKPNTVLAADPQTGSNRVRSAMFDPESETVKVRISNRYQIFNKRAIGLAFLFMCVVMIGAAWLPVERIQAVSDVQGGVRRLITAAGFVAGLGWLMIWRLAPELGTGLFELSVRQAYWRWASLLPAVSAAVIVSRWGGFREFVTRIGWGWVVIAVVLLFMTTLFGTDLGTGYRLWLRLPGGYHLQAAEPVKLLLIFFVASKAFDAAHASRSVAQSSRTTKFEVLGWFQRYQPIIGGFLMVFLALAIMRDFGPAVLLALVLLLLLLVQGLPHYLRQNLRHAGIIVALILGCLAAAYYSGRPARLQERLGIWRNPWVATAPSREVREKDPKLRARIIQRIGEGREHMSRVLWSISSGGMMGAGLGSGRPYTVREIHSDFMFAAFAEELGWYGGLGILLLLGVLVVESLRVAQQKEDGSEKILAAGLGILLGVQTTVTVGSTIGLFPVTGITLPFLSHGGSSLLINWIAVGILVGLAWRREAPLPFPPEQTRRANHTLSYIPFVFAGLWCILMLKLGWLQSTWTWASVGTRKFVALGGTRSSNPRLDERNRVVSARVVRGRVLDRNGVVLAQTTAQGRRYSQPAQFVHLVGMEITDHAGALADRVGMERSLNGPLMGRLEDGGLLSKLPSFALEQHGYDIKLTLDQKLQQRAYQLLKENGYKGCIVGIQPQTGEVLIAANYPSLDLDLMTDEAQGAEMWKASFENNRPEAPPFCYRRLYAPGSTFKTVIAAAAFDQEVVSPGDKLFCRGTYRAPGRGRPIHDLGWHRGAGGHGYRTLAEAAVPSCNCIFAEAGVKIGWRRLGRFVDQAGFGGSLPLLPQQWRINPNLWIEAAPSAILPADRKIEDAPSSVLQPAFLAQTAIGQRDVRMTPLHLALWTAAVANRGPMMSPSLVKDVLNRRGRTLWRFHPQVYSQAMSPETARRLTRMMEQVVEQGTGRGARVAGLRIAGKTGTPEEEKYVWKLVGDRRRKVKISKTNAVFIAFAPVEQPQLAVAVVIEDRRRGGAVAGPIASQLLRAASQ